MLLSAKTISIAARDSLLSQKQVQEVLEKLKHFYPEVEFDPIYLKTKGDHNLSLSLRELDKTDFFTKEIDDLVLSGKVRIGIHSAKDLPDPLPRGLVCAAVTKGIDPRDALVLRENDSLDALPSQSIIATSSQRREEAVCQLRRDFCFVDIRGTIEARIKKLLEKEIDGVVIAEAALIRLNLTHLNRQFLPGQTAAFQGKLAVTAREGDQEVLDLFKPLIHF